jgi:hypothetical protein
MLSTFLDKASGLVGRRFLLAWWFPTLIASAMVLFLGVVPCGASAAWKWWQAQETVKAQSGLLLGALVIVTLVAYLLQTFTRPLVRFYEGYWPLWLRRWFQKQVEQRWEQWKKERAEAAQEARKDEAAKGQVDRHQARYTDRRDYLHHEYPPRAERLLPTRLGNMLRAAEDYPVTSYGMEAVFWWPRLTPLLPDAVKKEIEDTLTPLLALLNLATLISIVAVEGSIYLCQSHLGNWGWSVLVPTMGLLLACLAYPVALLKRAYLILVGVGGAIYLVWCWSIGCLGPVAVLVSGLLLARLSYLGAVSQAWGYGQQIRAAVDLYRFNLLEALHIPLPPSATDERQWWEQLQNWLYNQDRGAARNLPYQHEKKKRE